MLYTIVIGFQKITNPWLQIFDFKLEKLLRQVKR